MSEPVISLEGVSTCYNDVYVHRDLNFSVAAGDVIGLVGGSGSGKTTLLREMLGLLRPSQGCVKLFGVDISTAKLEGQRGVRRRLGMLFQQGALSSALSVYDNIAFPLRQLGAL